MTVRVRPELTTAQAEGILTACGYYLDDADPSGEGDLASVPPATRAAIRRGAEAIRRALPRPSPS